jgi:hypothetical protein
MSTGGVRDHLLALLEGRKLPEPNRAPSGATCSHALLKFGTIGRASESGPPQPPIKKPAAEAKALRATRNAVRVFVRHVLHHIQEMLGHTDLKQTSTYLNVTRTGLHDSTRRWVRVGLAWTSQTLNPHGIRALATNQPLVN